MKSNREQIEDLAEEFYNLGYDTAWGDSKDYPASLRDADQREKLRQKLKNQLDLIFGKDAE